MALPSPFAPLPVLSQGLPRAFLCSIQQTLSISYWVSAASDRADHPQLLESHFLSTSASGFSLPLWLLLPVSCAGFSTCPMHRGVSQGSVVGSLEEPIHADGFDSVKELRVDLQCQHPSWASEPHSCCLWVHRPLSWHLLLSSSDLPLLGTCCGPKISQEPEQKPVPYIQFLKTVKFAFLTFLD